MPGLDDVFPADLLLGLEDLAGRELWPARPHPQVLLTPPQKADWSLPHLGWHLDVASPNRDEIPGIQVFVLIDDVAPRGGGTVAIAGSHRLHGARGGAVASAHEALRSDPVYATLFSPGGAHATDFFQPRSVRGSFVHAMEMAGEAGDAYLTDMRVLHAAAPNATKRPRLMLTNRYLDRQIDGASTRGGR